MTNYISLSATRDDELYIPISNYISLSATHPHATFTSLRPSLLSLPSPPPGDVSPVRVLNAANAALLTAGGGTANFSMTLRRSSPAPPTPATATPPASANATSAATDGPHGGTQPRYPDETAVFLNGQRCVALPSPSLGLAPCSPPPGPSRDGGSDGPLSNGLAWDGVYGPTGGAGYALACASVFCCGDLDAGFAGDGNTGSGDGSLGGAPSPPPPPGPGDTEQLSGALSDLTALVVALLKAQPPPVPLPAPPPPQRTPSGGSPPAPPPAPPPPAPPPPPPHDACILYMSPQVSLSNSPPPEVHNKSPSFPSTPAVRPWPPAPASMSLSARPASAASLLAALRLAPQALARLHELLMAASAGADVAGELRALLGVLLGGGEGGGGADGAGLPPACKRSAAAPASIGNNAPSGAIDGGSLDATTEVGLAWETCTHP
jgi:hypothetical protein